MLKDRQKSNLLIDAGLYVGFVLSMLLHVTGLAVHEWLGAGVLVFSGYHLLVHRRWVATVATKFFRRTSTQARRFLVIDAVVLAAFLAIGITGLAICTWLELPLADYPLWRDVHAYVSLGTLGIVVLKIALHWRWVMTTGRRTVAGLVTSPAASSSPNPGSGSRLGRREFARLMAGIGVSAAYAGLAVLEPFESRTAEATDTQLASSSGIAAASTSTPPPSATPTSSPAPSATATAAIAGTRRGNGRGNGASTSRRAAGSAAPASAPVQDSATATATPTTPQAATATAATATPAAATATSARGCVVRCSRACSYPGKCRKYVDANQNSRCDLGECL